MNFKRQVRSNLSTFVILLCIFTSITSGPLFSADESTSKQGTSNYAPILGSNFSPSAFTGNQNLQMNLGACSTFSGNAPPPEGEVSDELACSDPANDPTMLNLIKAQNDAVKKIATQKLTFLKQIETQLDCLKKQMNQLDSQISQLAKEYTTNIQKMKKDIQTMEELQKTRKEQLVDVQERLMGGKRGEVGLQAIEEQFDKVVNDMPQEINRYTNLITANENSKKAFEEGVIAEEASRMKKCFVEEKKANLKCENGKGNVTAKEHLLCIFEDAYYLSKTNRSKMDQELAKNERAQLETLLDQILRELPDSASFSAGTPEQGLQVNVPAFSLKNPDDLKKRYGSQLNSASTYKKTATGQIRTSKVNVYGYVIAHMNYCYQDAKASVRRDRGKKSTPIGRAQEQLKEMERNVDTLMTQSLDNYSNIWSKSNRALTGMHIPLETSGCSNAMPRAKLSCISKFNETFNGLLKGTTSGSEMTIMIKGSPVTLNGQIKHTFIQGTCRGIHGCVTYYQALGRDLEKEINDVDAAKARYVTDANNSVQNFTAQVAQNLKASSTALSDRVHQINQMLAKLGVESGLEVNEMKAEDYTYDKNGLVDVPKDLKALIGGQIGLLQLDSKAFSKGSQSIAQGQKEIQKKVNAADKANEKLIVKFNECIKEEKKAKAKEEEGGDDKLVDALAKALDGDVANNDMCSTLERHCEKNGNVDNLLAVFAEARTDTETADYQSLNSGIQDLCRRHSTLGEHVFLNQCEMLYLQNKQKDPSITGPTPAAAVPVAQ